MRDFPLTGTRELTADDFIYQLKRLAHPSLHSPILELMSGYILGLKRLHEQLAEEAKRLPEGEWLDLDRFSLDGVERVDRYTYRIRIDGAYPQLLYWLAMPFFAPVPREVDRFFSQPGMAEKNLTLDWWPVGTGPFMLVENNPNSAHGAPAQSELPRRDLSVRGRTRRSSSWPARGLRQATIPFIDKAVFSREKESIPYWNKFLQGYYDASGYRRTTSIRRCRSIVAAKSD